MLERTRKECLSHICIIHDVFHRLLTFFSVVLKTESERSLFFSWLGMIERWLLSQVGHEILWKISRYIYIYVYTWHINTSRICKLDCCDTVGNYNSNNDVWPRKMTWMTWNDAKLVKVQETNVFPRISYGSIYSDEGRCLCEEEVYLVERDMIVFPRLSSAFGS